MKKFFTLIAAAMISLASFAEDVLVTKITYTDGPFPFYPMGCEPEVIDGSLHFVPTGEWSQFFFGTGVALEAGDYKAVVRIKASKAGNIKMTAQNGWGADAQQVDGPVALTTEFADVTVKFNELVGGNYDFILKPEMFDGTVDVNSLEIYKVDNGPVVPTEDVLVKEITYTDGPFPYYPMGCEPEVIDGSLHFVPTGAWSQFFIGTGVALEEGNYKAVVNIKSTKTGQIKLTAQNGWQAESQVIEGRVPMTTTEFADVEVKYNDIVGGNYDFILKPETFDGTLDINKLTIYKVVPSTPTSINNVNSEFGKTVKVVENGKLVIVKNGSKFNAAGQMVK